MHRAQSQEVLFVQWNERGVRDVRSSELDLTSWDRNCVEGVGANF